MHKMLLPNPRLRESTEKGEFGQLRNTYVSHERPFFFPLPSHKDLALV